MNIKYKAIYILHIYIIYILDLMETIYTVLGCLSGCLFVTNKLKNG